MNPTELINPRCKLTGTVPVIRSTRHLFLDLPKLSDRLQHYIDSTSQLGGWTSNCMQVGCCTATLLVDWLIGASLRCLSFVAVSIDTGMDMDP
jgi:methionyl-tRNA synthetase